MQPNPVRVVRPPENVCISAVSAKASAGAFTTLLNFDAQVTHCRRAFVQSFSKEAEARSPTQYTETTNSAWSPIMFGFTAMGQKEEEVKFIRQSRAIKDLKCSGYLIKHLTEKHFHL